MSRLYKNAPLTEAICEVRFDRQSPWDLAVPGLVYEKLREIYPNRLRSAEFEIKPGPEDAKQFSRITKGGRLTSLTRAPGITEADILEFSDENRSELIRVWQNVISIHHIGQYSGWNNFAPHIHRAIDSYVSVAAPKNIERIGLRFVNRIQIRGRQIEMREYFNFYPQVGEELPQTYMGFTVSADFPFEDATVLRMRHAAEGTRDPEIHASRLDLDYFNSRAGSIELDRVRPWLQLAHERIRKVFEGTITGKLRAIFDGAVHG